MSPAAIPDLNDEDGFVMVVEYDKEDDEVDGITTIVSRGFLRGDIEVEITPETNFQAFIVVHDNGSQTWRVLHSSVQRW